METLEDLKKIKLVDEWLWISYKAFMNRRREFIIRNKNINAYREKNKLAMQRMRKRNKEEKINKLIRSVYWYEVHHPNVPMRAIR